MKKYLILFIAFIIIPIINSCGDIEFINDNSLVGTWRITSFVMDGYDITDQFSGCIITCKDDGTMIVLGDGKTYYCNWEWNDVSHSECYIQLHNCDQQLIIWQLQNVWNITDHNENICSFDSKASMHHNSMFWTRTE